MKMSRKDKVQDIPSYPYLATHPNFPGKVLYVTEHGAAIFPDNKGWFEKPLVPGITYELVPLPKGSTVILTQE